VAFHCHKPLKNIELLRQSGGTPIGAAIAKLP